MMLSFLEVDDVQAKAAVQGLLQSARIRGDGSKISLILLARLLDQLHCRGESGATIQKRAKWCDVIVHARDVVMSRLCQDFLSFGTQKESEPSPLHQLAHSCASQSTKISEVIYKVSKCFLETKFPLMVTETIARLISHYHCLEKQLLSFNSLEGNGWFDGHGRRTSMLKVEAKVVEVFSVPFTSSHIEEGFIITRAFKYATEDIQNISWQVSCIHNLHGEFKHKTDTDDSGDGIQEPSHPTPCHDFRVVLWSIMLEENEDGPKAVIEPKEGASFYEDQNSQPDIVLLGSLLSKHAILKKGMDKLKELGVKVILSSVYFPDWAVSCCRSYGICLVDMIDDEEWQCLQVLLNIQPLNSIDEIYDAVMNTKSSTGKMLDGMHGGVSLPSQIGIVPKVESYIVGNANFIRLVLKDIFQLVLCGPTITMCKQYSGACRQLFRYIENWLEASFHLATISKKSEMKDCIEQDKIIREKDPGRKDIQNVKSEQKVEETSETQFPRINQVVADCSDTSNHIFPVPSSSFHNMNISETDEVTTRSVYMVPSSGYQELFICYLLQHYIDNGNIGVENREANAMSGLAAKTYHLGRTSEDDGTHGVQEIFCKANCDNKAEGEKRNLDDCKSVLSMLDLEACTILLKTVEEIPKLLHEKASKTSLGKYLNYHKQHMKKFNELVNGKISVMEAMDGFPGCQSPFSFFEMLEMVLTMAVMLLRVDSVLKTHETIKDLKSKRRNMY
ncbi:uncharacterized protein LOC143038633 isoform X2 [Oratosquilla oratoria]